MPITWSPAVTVFEDTFKPNDTLFNISAVSDDILSVSVVYTMIVHDFPDTSIVITDGTGVHISGNSLSEFSIGNPIGYMENGLIPRTTYDPEDIVVGDDIVSWPADTTLTRDASITVKAEFFDIGEASVEFEENIYTITFYNTWDAHKASINSLMARLY